MSQKHGIIIIGAGICGLSIGWYLAKKGEPVTVLEKAEAGHGASWAAAGLLAARVEAEPGEERLLPLMIESRKMWPSFARELEDTSSINVDYRSDGILLIALNRDDVERLRSLYDYQRRMGMDVKLLTGYDARRLEPHLSQNVAGAISSPLDHQVDNRRCMLALRKAFLDAGGELQEHITVESVRISNKKVEGVKVAKGILNAEKVVLAAGAWSSLISGLPENVSPPIRPVRGQIVAVQMEKERPLLTRPVWAPEAYLVPRSDGHLILGSTVEEMGYDTNLTAGGVLKILRGAWETVPAIYDLPIAETWSGLRPGSPDDAPILGPTEIEGLIMATGHYRNGILLAPITAHAVTQYILTGELPDIAKPFTLERFKKRSD